MEPVLGQMNIGPSCKSGFPASLEIRYHLENKIPFCSQEKSGNLKQMSQIREKVDSLIDINKEAIVCCILFHV